MMHLKETALKALLNAPKAPLLAAMALFGLVMAFVVIFLGLMPSGRNSATFFVSIPWYERSFGIIPLFWGAFFTYALAELKEKKVKTP